MSAPARLVPQWIRIVVGILAILNLVFAIAGYANPGSVLPADSATAISAGQVFSARNAAIAVAMCIVALVGVPESMAIVTIIRALVEAQDIVLTLTRGQPISDILFPVVLLVIEVVLIVNLFKIANKAHEMTEKAH